MGSCNRIKLYELCKPGCFTNCNNNLHAQHSQRHLSNFNGCNYYQRYACNRCGSQRSLLHNLQRTKYVAYRHGRWNVFLVSCDRIKLYELRQPNCNAYVKYSLYSNGYKWLMSARVGYSWYYREQLCSAGCKLYRQHGYCVFGRLYCIYQYIHRQSNKFQLAVHWWICFTIHFKCKFG